MPGINGRREQSAQRITLETVAALNEIDLFCIELDIERIIGALGIAAELQETAICREIIEGAAAELQEVADMMRGVKTWHDTETSNQP